MPGSTSAQKQTPSTSDTRRPPSDDPGVYISLADLVKLRLRAKDINIFKPQLARSMLLGDVRSRFRGRGMEFEEVRPYQPGDDIRAIDWRVSARTGTTHTKLFAEERERPVHIVIDQRTDMFFGSGERFKSVMAAELGAIIGWAALGGSDRIGGQIAGDHDQKFVRAKRTRQAVMQLLNHIAAFNHALPDSGDNPDAPLTLTRILEDCQRIVRPGTAVFILSDFHDFTAADARALTFLGRNTDLSMLRISDPLEDDFDIAGRLGISDGSVTQSIDIHDTLRDSYRAEREQQTRALTDYARQAGARLIDARTDVDPVSCITRLYRGRRS